MEKDPHFKALEMMYLAAPINKIYLPIISVSEGVAEIEIDVKEAFFHSLGPYMALSISKCLTMQLSLLLILWKERCLF